MNILNTPMVMPMWCYLLTIFFSSVASATGYRAYRIYKYNHKGRGSKKRAAEIIE